MATLESLAKQLDRIEDRLPDLATRKSAHLMLAILQALRDKVIPEETEKIKAAVAALDHDENETGASA